MNYEVGEESSRVEVTQGEVGSIHNVRTSARVSNGADGLERRSISANTKIPYKKWGRLSQWSRSGGKRLFDCACVLLVLPLLLSVLLAVGLAVFLTSKGPILFLQRRSGRDGELFTILKFRTLQHTGKTAHRAVTTATNQNFTPIGPFLRRWKLDELPQLLNVLVGQMSLVGPRPKLPEHTIADFPCRPGITGAATFAFAREEAELASMSQGHLDEIYHTLILPTKHNLDVEYMAKATFATDLRLLVDTLTRRWNHSFIRTLLDLHVVSAKRTVELARANAHSGVYGPPVHASLRPHTSAEETVSM